MLRIPLTMLFRAGARHAASTDVVKCVVLIMPCSFNSYVKANMPEGRVATDNHSMHEADVFIKRDMQDFLKMIRHNGTDPKKCLLVLISGDKGFKDTLFEAHNMGVRTCVLAGLSNKSCAQEIWECLYVNWAGDWLAFIT